MTTLDPLGLGPLYPRARSVHPRDSQALWLLLGLASRAGEGKAWQTLGPKDHEWEALGCSTWVGPRAAWQHHRGKGASRRERCQQPARGPAQTWRMLGVGAFHQVGEATPPLPVPDSRAAQAVLGGRVEKEM